MLNRIPKSTSVRPRVPPYSSARQGRRNKSSIHILKPGSKKCIDVISPFLLSYFNKIFFPFHFFVLYQP